MRRMRQAISLGTSISQSLVWEQNILHTSSIQHVSTLSARVTTPLHQRLSPQIVPALQNNTNIISRMNKILMINQYTGIDSRSAIGTVDHPLANMDRAPTITELCEVFLKDGVALAVTAARKALSPALCTRYHTRSFDDLYE
jgi:predicted naringenin-chalcone synthase